MEFGGKEMASSTDPRNVSDDEEDGTPTVDEECQDHDPDLNMRDIAIMHMAKKNLCFELEYIQTVC